MKSFKFILFVWALAIAGIVMVNFTFTNYSTVFLGIATSDEIEISYPTPVEIKDINVVPGQEVAEDDLIMIVDSPELDERIETVGFQLEEIKARVNVSARETISQIEQIESDVATKTIEINSRIAQLEAQFQLNKDLTKDLKSINPVNQQSDSQNPIKMQIASLRQELELFRQSSNGRIRQLNSGMTSNQNPYEVQVKNLVDELQSLNDQKQKLNTYSAISGLVGDINFERGEKVSPYSPILAIYSKSPSYIRGFVHESVVDEIRIGDLVTVTNSKNSSVIEGEVIGVGSRIIEFPIRLRRNPEVGIWGREVQISIPENGLLLGEKVTIRLQ
ncbi:MAG: hypothetical protein RJQ09_12725 [Cyclobacteriaceae bacterium]